MAGNLGHHAEIVRNEHDAQPLAALDIGDQTSGSGLNDDIERDRRPIKDQAFGSSASAMAIMMR